MSVRQLARILKLHEQSIKERQADAVRGRLLCAELEPEDDDDSNPVIVSTQSEISTAVTQAVPVPSATKPAETSVAQQPDQPVIAVIRKY